MFRSPHGKNQWSGVGNIPLNEMFQSEPVRFNFGTPTSPNYKYFLMSASDSGALYTSSDGIT